MSLSTADGIALLLTLKLALVSTVVLLILGTPLLVALPLVLPPTVLGFYLLLVFAPNNAIGGVFNTIFGQSLAFSFTGLVVGSVVYSLPFVVQPLQNGFAGIGERPLEVAATLGAAPLDTFFSIVVPMVKPSFLTAMILGFAHTLGEFGVVLMIGGNIPGETQVASIAIYEHVETMQLAQAHYLSLSLLAISFILLTLIYALNRGSAVSVFRP